MIQVNANIAKLKPSATLAINERVKSLRREGAKLYHFGFGQSPFPVPQLISEELTRHREKGGYLPSLGLPELRATIASYLGENQRTTFSPKGVLIGPGSKELLFQTLLLLQGITLIPKGSWVSYLPQVMAKGGGYDIINTSRENAYKLSPDQLTASCLKHKNSQKALILNSPNNPTGAVYDVSELAALAEVCRRFQVIVLSDEIYSLLNFKEEFSPSMAGHYPEGTIVFGGLSKIFSAGGYRLGYMALPEAMFELLPYYQAIFSETFSAVATPVQYAAVKAFEMPQVLLDEIAKNKAILGAVARFVVKELREGHIECTPPEGGFYTIIDLRHYREKFDHLGLKSSEDIAKHLLEHAGVALLPGSDFYFGADIPVFRMAFVDFDGGAWARIPLDLVSSNPGHIREHAPGVYEGIATLKSFLARG